MTHANVERILGRLATDAALARRFAADRRAVIEQLQREGCDLSALEIEALAATDADSIRRFGDALDQRLRRLDLVAFTQPEAQEMVYNPFARGRAPVGVQTLEIRHATLGPSSVALELWYPATDVNRGRDLDSASRDRFTIARGLPEAAQAALRGAEPLAGAYPLVAYFHGGYGHRRDCSHLCTHLASHGYIVAAADFPGDNTADLLPGDDGAPATVATTPIDESARRRPAQAAAIIDAVASAVLPAGLRIEMDRIGVSGVSMGGFTALAVNSLSRRPHAVFAMCPMFGERSLVPQVVRLQRLLRVDDWGRAVPTFVLSGMVDALVNAEDMRALYARLGGPKHLVLVERAGHMHWSDNAGEIHERFRAGYGGGAFPDPELDGAALAAAMRPFDQLCSEEQGGSTARGLALAMMDAHLKGRDAARLFLGGDLEIALRRFGVSAEAVSDTAVAAAGRRVAL